MFGAICGDVLGAPYEVNPVKFKEFELLADNARFTDDTVCTVAIACAIVSGSMDFGRELKRWGRMFQVPYGNRFEEWMHGEYEINDSAGNGAVMRVSSIAWLAPTLEKALEWAARSVMNSHCHPESVRGAQAVVAAARLSLEGWERDEIKVLLEKVYGYDLTTPLSVQRPDAGFELLAEKTAPVAIRAFLEGEDFEDVLRLAISMGGDADTLAATAGGIAETYFEIPDDIRKHVVKRLHPELLAMTQMFYNNLSADTALLDLLAVRREDAEDLLKEQLHKWQIEVLPETSMTRKIDKWKKRVRRWWGEIRYPVRHHYLSVKYALKGAFK